MTYQTFYVSYLVHKPRDDCLENGAIPEKTVYANLKRVLHCCPKLLKPRERNNPLPRTSSWEMDYMPGLLSQRG